MARIDIADKGSKFIVLASTCIIIAGIDLGRDVLIPLALAILISFMLTPPVAWLERMRLRRTPAVLLVVGVGLAVLITLGYVVGSQFASVVNQFPSYQGELRSKINGLRSHGGFFRQLQTEAKDISAATGGTTQPTSAPTGATELSRAGGEPTSLRDGQASTTEPSAERGIPVRIVQDTSPLGLVQQYAASIFSPLTTTGLVLVFVIFMLIGREDLRDRMLRLVGHGRLNLTTQALDDAGSRISAYLGALAIVNTLYGVAVSIGLAAIGHVFGHGTPFPNLLFWGLLVAVLRFVPYVGVWLGAALPLALSFAIFPSSAVFLATLSLFLALEILVSQFVEPFWYGASTGMSALAVLVAAVFWTWLWGPIGLLLSTPLTVCLVVLGKYVPQLRFLDILLGDEPVLPPHIRVYQRLIASDEEDATDLVRSIREEKSLDAVYDEVLVPALALAELDHHRDMLDKERLEFIHQNVRQIVEEMGDEEIADRARVVATRPQDAAKDQTGADIEKPRHLTLPRNCPVNVLLLPAKGEADEIVALMLHQLLELRGYCPETASVTSLASEMVELIASKQADIVVVSAMPPAAAAHARYLCKRIHARFPEMLMAVGLWTAKSDLQKARQRIACAQTVPVVSTLSDMQHEIDQIAQPILVRGSNAQ